MRSIELARNGFLNKADRLRYQSNFNNDYRVALQEVAFLSEPASLPGSIFVLGDPLFYYLSGRRPAVPFLNAAGFSPPDLWERLVKSFYHTRPAYVFLPKNKLGAIRKYTPRAAAYIDETARFIATNYDVSHTSDTGTWYVVRHIVSASQPTEASTNAR
jgi:hypothetical protein